MIILDTNVLSALMRQDPDSSVVAWLDRQAEKSIWITSVTVMEIEFGLQVLPPGKRRSTLTKSFENMLANEIGGRIAPFDTEAALQAAILMAARRRKGRPGEERDIMIAGVVLSCHATLATRNTSHFDDLSSPVVNPWTV